MTSCGHQPSVPPAHIPIGRAGARIRSLSSRTHTGATVVVADAGTFSRAAMTAAAQIAPQIGATVLTMRPYVRPAVDPAEVAEQTEILDIQLAAWQQTHPVPLLALIAVGECHVPVMLVAGPERADVPAVTPSP